MSKKTIARFLCLMLSMIFIISILPNVGVRADDKVTINKQDCDITEIPDKYNSGAKGNLTTFTEETDQFGKKIIKGKSGSSEVSVAFKKSINQKTGEVSFNLNFNDNDNKKLTGEVVIENIDFSSYMIDAQTDTSLDHNLTIVFNNCKFAKIMKNIRDSKVTFKFNNCSIIRFNGSNVVFDRCAFGGSIDDPLVPFRNVTVKNSYVSDINFGSPTNATHIDGTQIYGEKDVDVLNIKFQNCRFEVPSILIEGSAAYVNSCLMVQIEKSDAHSISFENCHLNGGGYTIYAVSETFNRKMEDVSFTNIKIGAGYTFGAFYPTIDKNVKLTNITGTDSLFIGSVYKNSGKTYFSVSNDTDVKRELLIVTDKGQHSFTIPAGPNKDTLANRTFKKFSDLPVDILKTVDEDCQYAVCLDVTDPNDVKQIRFVNYTNNAVSIDKSLFGDRGDNVRISGSCGTNATYVLDYDGVLTISGTGNIKSYTSTADETTAPWTPYAAYIKKIVVNDGITAVGVNAFKNCYACTTVYLPDGVTEIMNGAFASCTSLENVRIPESCEKIGFNSFSGVAKDVLNNGGNVDEPTDTPTDSPVVTKDDPNSQITEFVSRIYRYVLNREPEKGGLDFWTDELYSYRLTGAQVGEMFIFSQEFTDRHTTDDEFVTILYKTFFGRDPETDGFNYWTGLLKNGTSDRRSVVHGFVYSPEWADTCARAGIRSGGDIKPSFKIEPTALTYAFVERMYTVAMGRTYDEEGREYWAQLLANYDMSGEALGAFFFTSKEMNDQKLSNKDFLDRLYKTFMNREGDADGIKYWTGVLESGASRESVVYGFTRSPEFTEKCVEARILPF